MPEFYQTFLLEYLGDKHYYMLQLVVGLLQMMRVVSLEKLATALPQPILFESRRRALQRFLNLDLLDVKNLWLPIVSNWLIHQVKPSSGPLIFAIDRTQWGDRNLLFLSLVHHKRAIPIYWITLKEGEKGLGKKGCSNLADQQKVLEPLLEWSQDYHCCVVGDREFHSVQLANWLSEHGLSCVLRQKVSTYICQQGQEHQRISELEMKPGMKLFLEGIECTKQKGFGYFNLAAYQRRNYQGRKAESAWYLLTNLETHAAAIEVYKRRMSIESNFKDYKSGGFNLEQTKITPERLEKLLTLMAIAYSSGTLSGESIEAKQGQKYVGRVREKGRLGRRHSHFWIGLYGQVWIEMMEVFKEIAVELMRCKPTKWSHFQRGLKAGKLIASCL